MPNRPNNFYSVKQLARLFGRTRNAIVVAAAKGKLGPPHSIGKRKFYSIEIAEAHYKTATTAAQRQAARNAPTEYEGQVNKQIAAAKRERAGERKANHDRTGGLVDLALRFRDMQWTDSLIAQGIADFIPPKVMS